MTAGDATPLRWLNAADVAAAMPPLDERLRLAARTMTALVADAELPPKIGVHPRPSAAFAHAMPAALHPAGSDGADDLLGIKWIAGFPGNRARDLPAIHGLVVLSDPATGIPQAVLDAGPITAERTAAVSGVAIRGFVPPIVGRPARVALLGAGVQARSHLPVVGRILPGCEVAIFDRHAERAAQVAELAAGIGGLTRGRVAATAREAVNGADVVVTVASFTAPAERQTLTPDWLSPDALVVAVDYATYVAASVARDAVRFIVDERGQFLANRDAGNFDGYPDPDATLGEVELDPDRPSRPAGRVLVTHLGVGLADLVFGDAILRRAVELELGALLPR